MNWVFQCNPKRFDLAAFLETGQKSGEWAMNQRRNLVSPGDRVFFWQTGRDAKLIAVGHVTSTAHEARENEFGRFCVGIGFEHEISPPLTRSEIHHSDKAENKTLAGFAPFTSAGAQGTNFPIEDPIVAALTIAIDKRLVPLSARAVATGVDDFQRSLDGAVKHARREITKRLRDHIADMDPIAFEWLVGALLAKLGYKHVQITKPTGDRGIDITAKLVAGGLAEIQTGIQVKRQQNVGRPAVQNLRGALGPHQAGLFVSSGYFTEGAKVEAQEPTKVPITLIDGSQLVELLLEHQIGVKHRHVRSYDLALDDLSYDELQAVVEEPDGGVG